MSEPILVTRALTKKYGGAAAVEGVDLYIEKGQIYGLVGAQRRGQDHDHPHADRPDRAHLRGDRALRRDR